MKNYNDKIRHRALQVNFISFTINPLFPRGKAWEFTSACNWLAFLRWTVIRADPGMMGSKEKNWKED